MTELAETAWLVDASYEAGRLTLSLIGANLEPFRWIDSNFYPYYLTEKQQDDTKVVKKLDLFTQNERTLYKVKVTRDTPKTITGWESEIDPALSYAYDKGLRFGLLHHLEHGAWVPHVSLDAEQDCVSTRFSGRSRDRIERQDRCL